MTCALTSAFSAGADIVVLMDASGTILPWFEEINNRVLVDITRKFVRQGDTFHLISFNSRVNLEIVQPIETEADISRVVSRFMLLYPLGQNSDFISGLHYTWQYVSSLEQSREKIVIVISDGIFNPPKDSPYAAFTTDQVKSEITKIARQIRGAGWNVYYIKLPFPEQAEIKNLDGNLISGSVKKGKAKDDAQSDGETASESGTPKQYYDVSSEFSSSLDITQSQLPKDNVPLTFIDSVFSMPEAVFPQELGKKGRVFILPVKLRNTSDNRVNMELTNVYWKDMDILGRTSFLNLSPGERGTLRAEIHLPKTVSNGSLDLPVRLQFSGGLRVNPQSGTVHLTVVPFSPEMLFMSGVPVVFSIILILLAILFVLFLILFVIRKTARPVPDAVNAAETAARYREETLRTASAKKASSISATAVGSAKMPNIPATTNRAAADILASSAKPQDTGISVLADYAAKSKVPSMETASPSSVKAKKISLFALSKERSGDASISMIASEQAAEKDERLSVLNNAAKVNVVHEAIRTGANADEPIFIAENSNIMLELVVGNQNSNIGKRNIHMMKAGSRLSIGGGVSAFLVFLVRFPSHIAEIRYDGNRCDLAILKPQYFPNETENVIRDCIGREFIIRSDKSYDVAFTLKVYEDPVLKLNRLLKSIG